MDVLPERNILSLPELALREIFRRLDVNTLLDCRSVCSLWNDEIMTPLHLIRVVKYVRNQPNSVEAHCPRSAFWMNVRIEDFGPLGFDSTHENYIYSHHVCTNRITSIHLVNCRLNAIIFDARMLQQAYCLKELIIVDCYFFNMPLYPCVLQSTKIQEQRQTKSLQKLTSIIISGVKLKHLMGLIKMMLPYTAPGRLLTLNVSDEHYVSDGRIEEMALVRTVKRFVFSELVPAILSNQSSLESLGFMLFSCNIRLSLDINTKIFEAIHIKKMTKLKELSIPWAALNSPSDSCKFVHNLGEISNTNIRVLKMTNRPCDRSFSLISPSDSTSSPMLTRKLQHLEIKTDLSEDFITALKNRVLYNLKTLAITFFTATQQQWNIIVSPQTYGHLESLSLSGAMNDNDLQTIIKTLGTLRSLSFKGSFHYFTNYGVTGIKPSRDFWSKSKFAVPSSASEDDHKGKPLSSLKNLTVFECEDLAIDDNGIINGICCKELTTFNIRSVFPTMQISNDGLNHLAGSCPKLQIVRMLVLSNYVSRQGIENFKKKLKNYKLSRSLIELV